MAKKISNPDSGTNQETVLLKKLSAYIQAVLNVSFMAKVVAVTPPTVSVQPLALTVGNNRKEGIIEGLMVIVPPVLIDGKAPKVNLKVGDHVGCGVFDHDTTHYNGHGEFRQMTTTPHLINNSYVIGKMAGKGDF